MDTEIVVKSEYRYLVVPAATRVFVIAAPVRVVMVPTGSGK